MNFSTLFGAEKIKIDDILKLKESAPDLIIWAAPLLFLLVLAEIVFSYYQGKGLYNKKETFGSVLVGIGNILIGLGLKAFLFFVFVIFYNLVPWRMELRWWTLVPCYIIFDFFNFLTHQVSHKVRLFWAAHVAHHSGEHYNLTVSFRLSWIQYIKIIFIFPVALLGFHPVIIFVTNQLAILFQFWVHTEYIRKLHPVIEYIFATPSNHRVHHGSQLKYINKNYGATFILWDRIFGSFQAEEEQPIYGITNNIGRKHDPITINFHEVADMIRDIRSTQSLREKLFFIFGDPVKIAMMKKENVRCQKKENNKDS